MSEFVDCSFSFVFFEASAPWCSLFLFCLFFWPSSCLNWCLLRATRNEQTVVTLIFTSFTEHTPHKYSSIVLFFFFLTIAKTWVNWPGLPAPPTVPNPSKRGQPVGVCMWAVIKVCPYSVRRKLPQLLLLLWQKRGNTLVDTQLLDNSIKVRYFK